VISVYRGKSAADLHVPEGESPLVRVRDLAHLDEVLEQSPLSQLEREAVRRAAANIERGRDANILVVANGALFRVELADPPRRLPTPTVPARNWQTVERGAAVSVSHPDTAWALRAATALRFVGYSARAIEGGPVLAVETAPPLVLLAYASSVTKELIEVASDRCAVVALVARGGAPPPGAHGSLMLPLKLATCAAEIDPLIRRTRSGRLRLGKATPRP
jgi:hypothetical protein